MSFLIFIQIVESFWEKKKTNLFLFFIINLNALAEFFCDFHNAFLTAMISLEILYENQQIKFLINFLNVNNDQLISLTVLFIS